MEYKPDFEVSDEELANRIDRITEAKTNDWRELAIIADITPVDLAEAAEGISNPKKRALFRASFKNLQGRNHKIY